MEAVIVATGRTPIGRATKGSLVDCRPDDLSALVIQALLHKLPALDPAEVEDVIWGTANPAGESGFNIARVAGLLAGIDAPGSRFIVRARRHCRPFVWVRTRSAPAKPTWSSAVASRR